jgi:uncharacterized protein HemX
MRSHPNPAFFVALGITTSLVAHGCAEKPMQEPQERTTYKIPAEPTAAPAENLETPPSAATGNTRAAALKAKEQFQQTLTENLRRLDEQMRELQMKVANLSDKAKADWAEKMKDLDTKRNAAKAKLAELQSATGDAWEHLREGSQAAWKELEQALEKATAEF